DGAAMTEAVTPLAGALDPQGLAPDIAGRITMALSVVERVRDGLAEKLAAFADVTAAVSSGLQRLQESGGLVPLALGFGLMLAAGLVAERLLGPRRVPAATSGAGCSLNSRLIQLMVTIARDACGLVIFSVAALAVMVLAGGRGQVTSAVLLTYLGAVIIVRT